MPFYQKRLRLSPQDYRGRRIFLVTLCCERRAAIFSDASEARRLVEHLIRMSAEHRYYLHAYCVMPDHVHFLCEGATADCDLLPFVETFKQQTAYAFGKKSGARLWQKRFYDHILRPVETIEDVACYIWLNPVRKNLCATPSDYPFCGSQTIDWIRRARAETSWTPIWK